MNDESGFKRVARALMSLFMVASGVLHFVVVDIYASMIPASFPAHRMLVWVSGVAELAGGIGLWVPWPRVRRAAAWGIVALLVAVYPANINMAINHVSPPGMHMTPFALWARLPFQLLFIAWAIWLARPSRRAR